MAGPSASSKKSREVDLSTPLLPDELKAGMFDVVSVGNGMAQVLDEPELAKCLAPNAKIVVETARFMLDLKAEVKGEFLKRVTAFVAALGAEPVKEHGPGDNVAVYARTA